MLLAVALFRLAVDGEVVAISGLFVPEFDRAGAVVSGTVVSEVGYRSWVEGTSKTLTQCFFDGEPTVCLAREPE
jgi:hypothetical protein